jgi:hypothetical protein
VRSKQLTADVRAYVTDAEKEQLEANARMSGMSLSQWSRQRLLEATQFSPDLLRVLHRMRTARQLPRTSSPDSCQPSTLNQSQENQ